MGTDQSIICFYGIINHACKKRAISGIDPILMLISTVTALPPTWKKSNSLFSSIKRQSVLYKAIEDTHIFYYEYFFNLKTCEWLSILIVLPCKNIK